jgi:hypothetical protein
VAGNVVIGMDPHKRSATIEVMSEDESVLGPGRYPTDANGYPPSPAPPQATREMPRTRSSRQRPTRPTALSPRATDDRNRPRPACSDRCRIRAARAGTPAVPSACNSAAARPCGTSAIITQRAADRSLHHAFVEIPKTSTKNAATPHRTADINDLLPTQGRDRWQPSAAVTKGEPLRPFVLYESACGRPVGVPRRT